MRAVINDDKNKQLLKHDYMHKDDINEMDPLKDYSYYLNNSNICHKYGQSNIESNILTLFIIIAFASALFYYFRNELHKIVDYLIVSGICVDALVLVINFLLFLKMKYESSIFRFVPNSLMKCSDILVFICFIIKTSIIVILPFMKITLKFYCLFLAKFLFDFYFLLNSIRILIFFPGFRCFQEIIDRILGFFKNALCDSEADLDKDNSSFSTEEEVESFLY